MYLNLIDSDISLNLPLFYSSHKDNFSSTLASESNSIKVHNNNKNKKYMILSPHICETELFQLNFKS